MPISGQPIRDTVVYAQDSKPSDERDGVLWVNTSTESRQLSVYSNDTAAWEPVGGDVPLMVTQEAVSYAETGVSVTHNSTEINGGAVTLPMNKGSVDLGTDDNTASASLFIGVTMDPSEVISRVKFTTSANASGYTRAAIERDSDGAVIAETFDLDGTGGEVFEFTGLSLDPTDTFSVGVGNGGNGHTAGTNTAPSFPYSSGPISVTQSSNGTTSTRYNVTSVEADGELTATAGDATVEFGSIPDDLAAWDLATWQDRLNGGSVTTDLETNDGSGWTTLAADVVPPYDISSVAPDTDIRFVHSLSVAATTDPTPQVPYSARRGER